VSSPGQVQSPEIDKALELLGSGTAQVLPHGGLAAKLATAAREGRQLRVKLGIDPSGSDLTLGHAVVLRKLRQFQDLGHLAVLIVGDFTGMVGDPTGRSQTRSVLTAEDTERNAASYVEQVMRVLDPDPAKVEIRRNSEWLGALGMADVLREAQQLTVARLLERDDFAKRYAAGQPISLIEFLYPLLQGYDSVAVAADVELGGTDQTYNLLVGRDLQRAHGMAEQIVLTVPLLVGTDGVHKMSKSLGNYVALNDPADEQFGKVMSIPDAAVETYARLCTDLPPSRCTELAAAAVAGGPGAAAAKREVAQAVVRLYHGEAAGEAAVEHFAAVFRDHAEVADLPEHVLGDGDPVHLPALLQELDFAPSRGAARRLVDQGAVKLGGVVVREYDLPVAALSGQVLAAGRRRQVRLIP
jgi:tyrosyl-tRNA synthetase